MSNLKSDINNLNTSMETKLGNIKMEMKSEIIQTNDKITNLEHETNNTYIARDDVSMLKN